VLLGYQYGQLAGNIHCESPRQDVDALRDGRIRIATDHQTFGRTFAAVNSISITGVNCHVLLNGHYKPKDITRYKANFAQLVTLSGRQEASVDKIIQDLKSRPVDPEELALLRNIHKTRISGHLGRGFIILDTNEKNETICLHEKLNYFDDAKRPLWFVYSGMGSQWAGMGAQLMRIPVFAAAIER
ncbi:jg26335, partial [Pararge aegeria aegeria]